MHKNRKTLQVALLKDKATINSLVSYLVKNGFVRKEQSTVDKRSVIISLTSKGQTMQELTIPVAMKNIGMAIEGIDEDALKTTITVLTQIINNLTKEKS